MGVCFSLVRPGGRTDGAEDKPSEVSRIEGVRMRTCLRVHLFGDLQCRGRTAALRLRFQQSLTTSLASTLLVLPVETMKEDCCWTSHFDILSTSFSFSLTKFKQF